MSEGIDVISEFVRAARNLPTLSDNATEREKDEYFSAHLRLQRLETMVRELVVNAKLYTYEENQPTD